MFLDNTKNKLNSMGYFKMKGIIYYDIIILGRKI